MYLYLSLNERAVNIQTTKKLEKKQDTFNYKLI